MSIMIDAICIFVFALDALHLTLVSNGFGLLCLAPYISHPNTGLHKGPIVT